MATYKVIQDIEAEDHLLGPLSFRQFIYGLIAAFGLYISFLCLTKGVGFLAIFFLPPALFSGFLAFPFGKDQPTEVWALAKLRFLVKPHRRVWNQSGVKEMVTITVPKRVEVVRTNGLNQTEVQSRLTALANTIDSRGWSIKNVDVNMYSQPDQMSMEADSDRLIGPSAMPQEVPNYDIQASDDILDEQSNPVAHQMDQMITAATNAHRQQIIQQLNQPAIGAAGTPAIAQSAGPPADYWFLNTPSVTPQTASQAVFGQAQLVAPHDPRGDNASIPVATADEQAFLQQMKTQSDRQQAPFNRSISAHQFSNHNHPLYNPAQGPCKRPHNQ
jgi:hypothetical protein